MLQDLNEYEPNHALLRTYYYDTPPYEGNNITESEKNLAKERKRFLEKLKQIDRFEAKLGKIQYRGRDKNGKLIVVQKGVDVNIAVDMIYFSERSSISTIVLITGDSDIIPAIEMVKNNGKTVVLYYSPKANTKNKLVNSLLKAADICLPLKSSFFE